MYKKAFICVVVAILVVGVAVSVATERSGATRGQRGRMGQRGPGMMGPGPMMNQWIEDLEKAYNANDRDAMGRVIAQMKQMQSRSGQMAGRGGPMGGPGMGGPGMMGPGGMGRDSDFMPTRALAKDEREKKILAVLADINTNERRGNMLVPEEDGRLLRLLVESVQAKKVVELGTSAGYSGTWMAMALQKTGGKLITHEIDEGRARLARENFKQAGVEDVVTLVMGDAHQTITQVEGPIDVVFLDADKEGYIDYMQKLMPKIRPGGLIIAHNMNPGQADQNFIKAITTDSRLETLLLHRDTGGVSVTMKKY